MLAVLQAILANLSGEMVAVMQNALANMNVSYTVAHRYSDPKSFREVLTIAYHVATFV